MIRRLFFFLILMTSFVSMAPGNLLCDDPPAGCDPDDIFGDPDDEFKPFEYSLMNDNLTEDTTSSRLSQKGKVWSDPSNDFLLNFWIRFLPGQFEK